jgi:hypothetical protein
VGVLSIIQLLFIKLSNLFGTQYVDMSVQNLVDMSVQLRIDLCTCGRH